MLLFQCQFTIKTLIISELEISMKEKILNLKEKNIASEYLNSTAKQNNTGEILLALHNIAIAQGGFTKLAKNTNLNRENLYKILHPEGNPQLNTFILILNWLGFDLAFKEKSTLFKHETKLNTIADAYPGIAKQWCYAKNSITLNQISPTSKKKVWWKCIISPEHNWEATCHNRIFKKQGCPFCSGKKSSNSNNLQTLYPEISNEWHPTKNGDLTPSIIAAGSNKKIWWLCQNGHEWQTLCNSRTGHNRSDCPFCIS